MFIRHPISTKYKNKVTNQETIKFFDRAKKAIKSRRLSFQILSYLYFSSFVFKDNHDFNEKNNPLQKIVIFEEYLDDIDIDVIVNQEEYLLGLVFIDEECGNIDGGELNRKINQKKIRDVS